MTRDEIEEKLIVHSNGKHRANCAGHHEAESCCLKYPEVVDGNNILAQSSPQEDDCAGKGGFVFAVYSIYGDESHDELKQRSFAVGTACGRESEWRELEAKWNERLRGKVFHAADCETDKGDFASTSHQENLDTYKDLCTILCESELCGVAHSVCIEPFRQIFPDAISDMPFYLCFCESTYASMRLASMCIPIESIEVIFDRHPETEYNSGLLYDMCVHNQTWRKIGDFADRVSFATRKTVGIQVSDLIAREAMKAMDNVMTRGGRPVRKSMQALLDTKRFDFQYWSPQMLVRLDAKLKSIGPEAFNENSRKYGEMHGQPNL